MERLIHILDLENTIVNLDFQPWIIKKTEPNIPIIRFTAGQRKLIESGTFRGEDYSIKHNGREFWISERIYRELEKKTKKDVDLVDYGISYAEFIDPDLINEISNKLDFRLDNIDHLKNTKDDVIIVSERSDLELHEILIQNVRNKLVEFNINVNNFYMLASSNLKNSIDDIPLKKELLVIEKLIGYKIEDEKFTNVNVEQYNKVYFYDDDRLVFEEMKTLQETFNKIYFNSNEEMKGVIMEKVIKSKPFAKIHLITGNEFNKFIVSNITLERPSRIHKFNFFK